MRTNLQWYFSIITSLLLCTAMPAYADDHDSKSLSEGAITGAGAHFSWLVFDELKPGLEKKFGRPLKLYGRESMLGAGCNAGIKTARKSTPDHETFGLVCCPLSKEEVKKNGLQVHPIALEPIVILLNKANPVSNLSSKQVRAIFKGEITNWVEVGGPEKPIIVVTRLHCKKRPGHWKTILPSADLFRKERLNVKSAAEMIKRVEDFPFSIGHTGATWKFSEHITVKIITVNKIKPTGKNLQAKNILFTGSYLL